MRRCRFKEQEPALSSTHTSTEGTNALRDVSPRKAAPEQDQDHGVWPGLTTSHGSCSLSLAGQVSPATSSAVILQTYPENEPNSNPFVSQQQADPAQPTHDGRMGQSQGTALQPGDRTARVATSQQRPISRRRTRAPTLDIPGIISNHTSCSITDRPCLLRR